MKKLSVLDARSGVYLVTGPDAEKLVEAPGAKNRPLSQARVNRYAERMRTGKWKLNGEPLLLDPDGRLLDGEHRCRAVMDSGREIETVVLWGDFGFATMGQGAMRSGSDALSLALPSGNSFIALAAVTTLCIKHDRAMKRELSPYSQTQNNGGENWMDIDNADRVTWARKNPRALEICALVRGLFGRDKAFISMSVLAAAWFLVERVAGEAKATEFFSPLITGVGLSQGDVRLLLRRTCVNRTVSGGRRVGGVEALHWIAKAWATRGASGKQTFVVKTTENFPFIR